MIIWQRWGVLAALYAAIAVALFAGFGSTFLDGPGLLISTAVGLVVAAVATWFTGIALNQTAPAKKVAEWSSARRSELDDLVESGRFSIGPGKPQPTSFEEARAQADALFAAETARAKGGKNKHTLFFIPMQYFAFVFGAIALVLLVLALVR